VKEWANINGRIEAGGVTLGLLGDGVSWEDLYVALEKFWDEH
jgi:hypothetical protein